MCGFLSVSVIWNKRGERSVTERTAYTTLIYNKVHNIMLCLNKKIQNLGNPVLRTIQNTTYCTVLFLASCIVADLYAGLHVTPLDLH